LLVRKVRRFALAEPRGAPAVDPFYLFLLFSKDLMARRAGGQKHGAAPAGARPDG
jgi:hypothetical protein